MKLQAMRSRTKIVVGVVALGLGLAVVLGFVFTRGDEKADFGAFLDTEAPVGAAMLPDLMPKPQLNVTTERLVDRWYIRFSTIIVNIGDGEFLLRATRQFVPANWTAEQLIPHSGGGAEAIPIDAQLAWGGDGHGHWHVVRVATVRLVPLDEAGRPVGEVVATDSKIGFCFYDHTHELGRGPEEDVYSADTCGEEDDSLLGMGLSPGWNDTYRQSLPGQSIEVTGLPDGKYRLFTDVDEHAWFREVTRENNRTWIDIDLRMTPAGLSANTVATGPQPS
jgi:hypothetical protein